MKKFVLSIAIVAIFFTACNTADAKIKERLSASDSVAINYFRGDGKMDTVVAVKIIKDQKIITQLVNMIGESTLNNINQCGYDGSLHFFKHNEVIQSIDFRMNDVNCMQFTFKEDGENKAGKLSPEAKQLLESIRK